MAQNSISVIVDVSGTLVNQSSGSIIPSGSIGFMMAAAATSSTVRFLELSQDSNQNNRLRVETYTDTLSTPDRIIYRTFCLSGSSNNLNINGSVTSASFSASADLSKDIYLNEIRLIMSDNSVPVGADKFAAGAGLTNGVLVEVISSGSVFQLGNIQVNEDFFTLIPSKLATYDQNGAADVIAIGIDLGGQIKLYKNTSDKVRITIRDNLAAVQYFKCIVYGVK